MLRLKNWLLRLQALGGAEHGLEGFSPPKSAAWSLRQYRELVRTLPVPSPAQMDAFAQFVCNAHSWYKHLPILPPGRPFRFFIDPGAGMQLTIDKDGNASAQERVEKGFHYAGIPTVEYRERFGHLSYSRSAGTIVALQQTDGTRLVGADDEAVIFDPTTGVSNGLPDEVLKAGTASVSGLVHALGPCYLCHSIKRIGEGGFWWPEEGGGAAVFSDITARCDELLRDPGKSEPAPSDAVHADANLMSVDWKLHLLLAKERNRQRTEMVRAMRRVVELALAR